MTAFIRTAAEIRLPHQDEACKKNCFTSKRGLQECK